MKSVPHLSSHDGSGRVQLEDFGPSRNRKVEGSNPSSGSKTAGHWVHASQLRDVIRAFAATIPVLTNTTS
jgi:hypothetical protein